MGAARRVLPLVVCLAGGIGVAGQGSPDPGIVGSVRAAMASGGLTQGELTLSEYRSTHAATPDVLEALLWLARGALSAGQFDKASQLAEETRDLAGAARKAAGVADDARLLMMLESSIDVTAHALVKRYLLDCP